MTAWSSSRVSWRTVRLSLFTGLATSLGRLGGWRGSILQAVLPRSLVGCGVVRNRSGRFGGAGQADITGAGVLRRKCPKP